MELSIEKKQLINEYSNKIIEIIHLFLQNKLFQPIGIELSAINIKLETSETYSFKGMLSESDNIPLAFYRPDTDSIHIFIEHKSFTKRADKNEKFIFLMFVLFHEACHRLFLTFPRKGERDHELWNIATDLEIHNMYYVYNSIVKNNEKSSDFYEFIKPCEYITKFLIEKTNKDEDLNEGLFEIDYLNNVAEEIYNDLISSKKEQTTKFTFDNKGNLIKSKNSNSNSGSISVTVSTYTMPSGKKFSTSSIDYSNLEYTKKTAEEQEKDKNGSLLRKTILENTLKDEVQRSKNRGYESAKYSQFLKKMFHVKIDWKKILRNSLQTALEKADFFSWSRPRISMFGMQNTPYLPSQCCANEKYGVLIVTVDESGSMSNDEVAKAAGIIADSKEYYKKIIVIKHDTEISDIQEFEELTEDAKMNLLKRTSHGGTSHEKVFKWINDYSIKNRDTDDMISCVIVISDLYSDIEETQKLIPSSVPMIYLAPENVSNTHPEILGTIIPVEL